MKLYLIRHGETFGNVLKIIQGQKESKYSLLNKKGLLQVKKLGERFKDVHIDFVYSSDLIRAVDTANEILKFHPKLKLKIDKLLRERYFGKYEGKHYSDDFNWDNLPLDIESNTLLQKRAKDFLDKIYKKHKDKTVIVVSHGAIKREFLKIFKNVPPEEWIDISPKNTSVSFIEFNEDKSQNIHLVNCTKHLD
jgi:broad specificity phosphatase PhoE